MRRPLLLLLLAAVASGTMLWLAQPARGGSALAWVALVPAAALAIARAGSWEGRLAVPLALGLGLELMLIEALPFGLAAGQLGDPPPIMIGDSPVIVVALLIVPAFTALLYWLRFGSPWPGSRHRAGPLAVVLWPALCWTALDTLRIKLDPGGLWGTLLVTQHDTQASQIAALGGPWLITLSVAAVGYALALALVDRELGPRLSAAAAVAGAVLLALAGSALGGRGVEDRELSVAAVQPGYDTSERERTDALRFFRRGTYDLASLDLLEDLGGVALAAVGRDADLVVLPEATLWADPHEHSEVGARMARLARALGAALVAPAFDRDAFQGEALAVTAAGAPLRAQPKQRPMWFLGEEGGNRVDPRPVEMAGVSVGTLLGVDTQDAAVARRLAAAGADVLVSSTHDWRQQAPQHLALARLAGAATGRPLVRADWRYGTAAFAADGTELAALDDRERTAAVVAVQPAERDTPYVRIGDVVGWGAVGAVLVAALALGAGRLRRRGAGGPAPR